MNVGRLLPAVLDVHVLVDHAAVERARPVKRIGRDDVGEPVGLHLDQQVANARALELEDALGFPALQELEGHPVVHGKPVDVDGRLGMALVDDPHGRFQGGQVAQAEEVHLEQPGFLDVAHVPLGADDLVLVAPADDLKRNQGLERLVGDHHARGVRAGVLRGTLEPLREPDQPFDLGVLLDHRRRAGSSLRASSSVMLSRVGISLLICSTRARGMLSTRPTSLIAALAFIVPKVPIWATLASPYFFRT